MLLAATQKVKTTPFEMVADKLLVNVPICHPLMFQDQHVLYRIASGQETPSQEARAVEVMLTGTSAESEYFLTFSL